MHLLYTRSVGKTGGSDPKGVKEGHASLESLRESSGMPAWLVWELTEELQELGFVSCVWDSRALRSPSSENSQTETSGEQRFLLGTQARLTDKGRSYPPLQEYSQQRQQRHWEKPKPTPSKSRQPRPSRPSHSRQPAARKLEPMNQPSRAYHVYRPRERAARRLVYLSVIFSVAVLAVVIYLLITFT